MRKTTIPIVYKKPPSLLCKVCRIVLIVLLLARLASVIMNFCGFSFYINGTSQLTIMFFVDALIIASAVGSFNFEHARTFILPAAVGLFVIGVYAANLFPYNNTVKHLEFVSPDKSTTVVLKQKGYLFSGETGFYVKVSSVLIKDTRERVSRDDGYQPLNAAEVSAQWKDEKNVVFIYSNRESGEILLKKEIALK